MEFFTQKIVTKLSIIWVWDPRSRIWKKSNPDPVVKKAPDPGWRNAYAGNIGLDADAQLLLIVINPSSLYSFLLHLNIRYRFKR